MSKKSRNIERRQSSIHGNGVFATADIPKGTRIVRYKGALRTHAEVDEQYGAIDEDGHTFLFTLNDDYVIDANEGGNIARWINYSCAPNCEAVLEENAKGKRHKDKVFIEAMRDIQAGEELSYNYGIVLDEPHTDALKKLWACCCGAPNCTGTMLQPKEKKKPKVKKPAKTAKAPAKKTAKTAKSKAPLKSAKSAAKKVGKKAAKKKSVAKKAAKRG